MNLRKGRVKLKSQIVCDDLVKLIREGRLAPGEKLPAEPELARQFEVNPLTVRQGLMLLRERGMIETRPRVGNFVCQATPGAQKYQIAIQLPGGYLPMAQAFANITTRQIDESIDRERFGVTLLSSDDTTIEVADPCDYVVAHGMHGLLLYPRNDPARVAAARRALDAGVKISLLAHAPSWEPLDVFSIRVDEPAGIAQSVRKLVELGHRRIGVVLDQGWEPWFHDRYRDAVRVQFARFDLGPSDAMTVYPTWDPILGERNCEALGELFSRPQPPTAMIVPDESFAMGVFRFCYREGIRIPENLSLVSIQNHTPYAHPVPLSSPASDAIFARGVRAAIDNLIAQIEGKPVFEQTITLRCDIQWTQSVASPRSA